MLWMKIKDKYKTSLSLWNESWEDQLSRPTTHSVLLADVFTIKKSDLSVKWERVFPQDSSINFVSNTPSLHIRAGSLAVDNTIKNDYLPYGNYSSRCVVHMNSTFAFHISIQAVEVSWIVVPIETSLWLDMYFLSLQMSYHDHKILGECPRAVKRSKRKTHTRILVRYPYRELEVLSVK